MLQVGWVVRMLVLLPEMPTRGTTPWKLSLDAKSSANGTSDSGSARDARNVCCFSTKLYERKHKHTIAEVVRKIKLKRLSKAAFRMSNRTGRYDTTSTGSGYKVSPSSRKPLFLVTRRWNRRQRLLLRLSDISRLARITQQINPCSSLPLNLKLIELEFPNFVNDFHLLSTRVKSAFLDPESTFSESWHRLLGMRSEGRRGLT